MSNIKEYPKRIDYFREYAWKLISMDLKMNAEEYLKQKTITFRGC